MKLLDANVNTEAGDYLEDDPRAWAAIVEAVQRYALHNEALIAHVGSEPSAAAIIAGAMASFLADQHGVYLRSEPRP